MSPGDRELVGDLSASEGVNPDRSDGSEDVSGVMDAFGSMPDGGTDADDGHPFPATIVPGASARDLPEIECPIDGCDYTHLSSQGLAGHIPNAGGSDHGWNAADVSPADLHELASRGTHPEQRVRELIDGDSSERKTTDTAERVGAVRAWCEETLPVDMSDVQVYVNPSRRRIEINPRGYLGEEFTGYRTALQASKFVEFDPSESVTYVKDTEQFDLFMGGVGL